MQLDGTPLAFGDRTLQSRGELFDDVFQLFARTVEYNSRLFARGDILQDHRQFGYLPAAVYGGDTALEPNLPTAGG